MTAAPWAAGRSSQVPDQGQIALEGDVGVVVDRAVGVALGDVVGEVVVERFAVGDPVGADDARVADVDRARVGDVEPDPEAHQEERRDQQPGRRPDRAQPLPAAAEPDPQRPAEQVEQHRVLTSGTETPISARLKKKWETPKPSRTSRSRLATRQRPAPVDQADQEDRAERQEDVGRVELVAEGARVAARHLPGDLVAGPRLLDLAARADRRGPAPPRRRRRSRRPPSGRRRRSRWS